jgi:coenzyme F420 biosynthesis associated uncharacterized protein
MATSVIDWTVALNTAKKLVKPGPEISRAGAVAVVGELRATAARAEAYVTQVTGLQTPSGTAPVLIVDRERWIQANLDAFRQILLPLTTKASERLRTSNPATNALGSRVTGVEVGALLSYLAPKVLGQFDPFFPGADGEVGGRLLLVAPNVVSVERELDIDPADFRLWVCLHEETHRVQFTAVPWMREHLQSLMGEIVGSLETDPGRLLSEGMSRIGELVSGKTEGSLIDLVSSPEQKKVIDKITGVMSLLEGHADVVMDGVGPEVIPTVADIRAKFTKRRKGVGTLDKLLRRLLGLDQKMAQYRDGAIFVRRTVDTVGMDGFNAVFAEPANLPSKDEIHDPESWLRRVHG